MSDFAPGDVVVCVDASPCKCCGDHVPVRQGATYRVDGYSRWVTASGKPSIRLSGTYHPTPHHPYSDGINAERFRKLDKADEQFTETVRACKPIKQPVPSESDRSLIYSLAIEEALERSRVADERVRVWIEGRVK